MKVLRSSWSRAWESVSRSENERLFERLVAAYSEPQRHYHTLQHLRECAVQAQACSSLAEQPHEVEFALWFHDAIYDVRAHDNEVRSAEWARQEALAAGAEADVAARIHALVSVTRHTGIPGTSDEQLLVDIDLSILGADIERFDAYERQVREEYALIPEEIYRVKRVEVLARFLARPHIFGTLHFRELLEGQARGNLQRSVARLGV